MIPRGRPVHQRASKPVGMFHGYAVAEFFVRGCVLPGRRDHDGKAPPPTVGDLSEEGRELRGIWHSRPSPSAIPGKRNCLPFPPLFFTGM